MCWSVNFRIMVLGRDECFTVKALRLWWPNEMAAAGNEFCSSGRWTPSLTFQSISKIVRSGDTATGLDTADIKGWNRRGSDRIQGS
jgi:hypothetical protein